MVLLPTPLKAFTDTVPDVKAMLRICARNLYGWQCDHESMSAVNAELDNWQNWDDYPESWPKAAGESLPLGVIPINPTIINWATRHLNRIKNDLENAEPHYPREAVRNAMAYWDMDIN